MSQAVAAVFGEDTRKRIHDCKLLVVGAGGIGCELLKNLVMTGFRDIIIVDLDTIDVSNLNRQFLFNQSHVGRSKAEVARESALRFNPSATIDARHANVKNSEFSPTFYSQFNIVMNALDNIDARRHVNRLCLAADIPLIESGTQGYLGQTTVIKKKQTQCFECEPKPPPKQFAVCTITDTPSRPIHCVVWGKYLFGNLFGPKTEGGHSVTQFSADIATANPEDVFHQVFHDDVAKKTTSEFDKVWEGRNKPTPMTLQQAQGITELENEYKSTSPDVLPDQIVATVAACAELFISSFRSLQHRGTSLEFDKDDIDALNFVTAAANLREHVYAITRQSKYDIKEMAGNIVPAIATTNAIIAGQMVLEAIKILQGRLDECKTVFKMLAPTGRRNLVIMPTQLQPPASKCPVCSGATAVVVLNTAKTTLKFFVDKILKGSYGFTSSVIIDSGDSCIELAALQEDGELEEWLPLVISLPKIGITDGKVVTVEDEAQALTIKFVIRHSDECDPDGETPFRTEGDSAQTAAEMSATAATTNGTEQEMKTNEAAATAANGADGLQTSVTINEEDDCVMVENAASVAGKRKEAEEEDMAGSEKRRREN